MIPEEITRFLEGATVAYAGTRDDKLVPQIHQVSGLIVGPDRQTITCLIPDDHSETLIRSLEDNGRFALLVVGSTTGPKASKPPNPAVDYHECYQFKGDYVGSRRAADGDISVVYQTRRRFQELFRPLFGFSEEASAAYIRRSGVAVTFRVQEIFDQTPGPGAGRRIVPEEA
jgi:hypothetical protein